MPYPNQNYYSTNPAYNQYMQQYQQYQQPNYQQNSYLQNPYLQSNQNSIGSQPLPQSGIVGKILDDFSAITANDVPMDGQPATFIKRDGSEIQIRNWTPQGTIATTSYKPVIADIEQKEDKETDNGFNILNEDMKAFREEINGRFDKLEKAIISRNGRTKKEVSEEE